MSVDLEATVRDIALEYPHAVRVFESFGIDYCCGGGHSLEEACREANVDINALREALRRPANVDDASGGNWASASLEELADHIVARHHTFVRQETVRLMDLLGKVKAKHEANHPELNRLEQLFRALASELKLHMLKEEQVLFPYIVRLEENSIAGEPAPPSCFGTVANPITAGYNNIIIQQGGEDRR
jgi:regulator of cell morphogenesis and NO signaling